MSSRYDMKTLQFLVSMECGENTKFHSTPEQIAGSIRMISQTIAQSMTGGCVPFVSVEVLKGKTDEAQPVHSKG